jgi:hypothetical protein
MTAAYTLLLAATLASPPADGPSPQMDAGLRQAPAAPLATAIATRPVPAPEIEPWMVDRPVRRPGALHVLYGTLGVLQALDVYSTRRALTSGASEANPLMKDAAGQAAMIAVKAASTAGAIYFSERAWRKNRKGAVVMMALVNGVTAAVVARNFKNVR